MLLHHEDGAPKRKKIHQGNDHSWSNQKTNQFRSNQKQPTASALQLQNRKVWSPDAVINSGREQGYYNSVSKWKYHLQAHCWCKGQVKGEPTSCRYDSTTDITLQNHTVKAVTYFGAGPQSHTMVPKRSEKERTKLTNTNCSNWMERTGKWLISIVLKQLWRKTVPKQTRSLNANKHWQRQKAWTSEV